MDSLHAIFSLQFNCALMTENGLDVLAEVESGPMISAELPGKTKALKHSVKIGGFGEAAEKAAEDDGASSLCV